MAFFGLWKCLSEYSWICNVALVSGVQQRDSATYIHVSVPFQILFLYRSLQRVEQISLCCTVGPRYSSIPYMGKTFWIREYELELRGNCLSLSGPLLICLGCSLFHLSRQGCWEAKMSKGEKLCCTTHICVFILVSWAIGFCQWALFFCLCLPFIALITEIPFWNFEK